MLHFYCKDIVRISQVRQDAVHHASDSEDMEMPFSGLLSDELAEF